VIEVRKTVLLLASMAVALLLASGVAVAAAIIGTPSDDRLVGTPGADSIDGLAGDDTIYTRGGNDTVSAGAGRDYLRDARPDFSTPTPGDVTMEGGPGSDVLYIDDFGGRRGNDKATLSGGRGSDFFHHANTDGNDVISGGPGEERYLTGAVGNDVISGGSGSDYPLQGGEGADKVSGGPGNDVLAESVDISEFDDSDLDVLSGGGGNDLVYARERPAAKDIIGCGGGFDRAVADTKDIVSRDCEKVFYTYGVLPDPTIFF
jgi:Ca2+-binding RTX toxin-like protein